MAWQTPERLTDEQKRDCMRILRVDKHMASITGHVFTAFDGAGKTAGPELFRVILSA